MVTYIIKYWYKYVSNRKYKIIKEAEKQRLYKKLYDEKYKAVIQDIQHKISNSAVLNFKHSGHLGDIIYSLPVIRELSKSHTCNLFIVPGMPVKN